MLNNCRWGGTVMHNHDKLWNELVKYAEEYRRRINRPAPAPKNIKRPLGK